ncbi:hypothetical protein NDK47_05870 [Brevibacillus ruminantium]|uniref:50S ribosomal protein L33 n=1 Tax=Brevibacillus ruminantium TaxID=2950604 RepID=A0ABY4WI53_9BACL|nr:hypothetical protein [Brevibacillus ruminantium]USG66825.1 hypothetical protein NDK47_05870 [Brevibacillus ruminantium]
MSEIAAVLMNRDQSNTYFLWLEIFGADRKASALQLCFTFIGKVTKKQNFHVNAIKYKVLKMKPKKGFVRHYLHNQKKGG